MKKVVSNKEIAHLWAHQTQPEARANSTSFKGASFYSYQTEIARIIERKGRKAYLVNETGYSMTTSGHQSRVRQAIPDSETRFILGDIGRGRSLDVRPALIFEYAVKQAADARGKAKRARTGKEWHAEREQHWLKQAQAVSEFFGLRRKVDEKAIVRLEAAASKARRQQAKEARERQVRIERENEEKVQAWVRGEDVYFPSAVSRVYLRAMPEKIEGEKQPDVLAGTVMETSRGVTIPLPDAERAFRFAIAYRTKGWHRNGEQFKVGEYQLDAVSSDGIVAGCHRIDWREVERFAATQGWTVNQATA